MIKNIVFDMGRVLVDYDAEQVCRHFIPDETERRNVKTSVFVSPEWLMLDMGVIPEEEALIRMQERLETEHEKELAALCLNHWHEYNMWPMEGMGELIRELKKIGYHIYLCSNASLRLLSCYEIIPRVEEFDGLLFSAQVQCIKPQREMYEHLFRQFDLVPEECFFIDDLQMNIDGARACGMDGYCYEDRNRERLRERLLNLNR